MARLHNLIEKHVGRLVLLSVLALLSASIAFGQYEGGGAHDRDRPSSNEKKQPNKPKSPKPPVTKPATCISDTALKRISTDTTENTKRFLYFTIPALLNGSNMDPSPLSNASVDLSTEELRLKLGLPGTFKSGNQWKKGQWWTASLSPFVSSNKEKKASLLSKGAWAANYGVDFGFNIIPPHRTWIACPEGVEDYKDWTESRAERGVHESNLDTIREGDRVSEAVWWYALRGSLEQKEYTLFYPGSSFDGLVDKRKLGLGRGYASINYFFHSELRKHRWWNWMGSAGVGTGSFTNYTTLTERTLHEGSVVYNGDGTTTRMITQTTSGRLGPLTVTSGVLAFAEAYKTVAFLGSGGAVRVGGRYDMIGLGTDEYNTRLAPGIFINAKKPGKDGEPPSDVVNVAIIYQMDQFQMTKTREYWQDHTGLSISAAFPFRFK